jgi:endonuclease/exonuclease/phosphatase family metal-dependent hydrolase
VRPPLRQLGTRLVAVVVSALAVIGLTLFAVSSPSSSGASFSLLQMNLCLSGQAGCYSPTAYPSALDEAATVIDDRDPDAVTINEACRHDVAELARRTGYELTFTGVDYGGVPLPCIDPRGRGLFGIAVLTKDHVRTAQDRAFTVRADPEERRWLCATTDAAITVCTAHLSTRYSPGERVDNDVQCRQLRQVLTVREDRGTTFFGGDLNRQASCAPTTMWSLHDTAASQSAGVQHIYASNSVDEPSTSVVEATYTDHDFLLAAAPMR